MPTKITVTHISNNKVVTTAGTIAQVADVPMHQVIDAIGMMKQDFYHAEVKEIKAQTCRGVDYELTHPAFTFIANEIELSAYIMSLFDEGFQIPQINTTENEFCFVTEHNGVDKVVTSDFLMSKHYGVSLAEVRGHIGNVKGYQQDFFTRNLISFDDGGTQLITSAYFKKLRGFSYGYQQAITDRFLNAFEQLEYSLDDFNVFFDKAGDGGDVSALVTSKPDGLKVLGELSEMTQEQRTSFVREFNAANPDKPMFSWCHLKDFYAAKEMTQEQRTSLVREFNAANPDKPTFSWCHLKDFYAAKEKLQAHSVYLRNGEPVIKATTLSRLLGWKHDSIITEIHCWLTGDQSINFFETDYSCEFDYEVTKQGYELLLAEFGISNQTQANNEDAICAAFAVFENISDMGVSQPEEIALAVEIIEDLMQKYVGHLTIYAALTEFNQDPVKFQHHQLLLNMFHLSFIDGCLFIADRCPLVDYDLLHWHPDSITGIPHDFGTIRPSIMIRLFESKLNSDTPF